MPLTTTAPSDTTRENIIEDLYDEKNLFSSDYINSFNVVLFCLHNKRTKIYNGAGKKKICKIY